MSRMTALDPELAGLRKDQFEILPHQAQRKLSRVVVPLRRSQFPQMGGRYNSRFAKRVEQKIAGQAQLKAQRERLRDGLHTHAEHRVYDKLHRHSRAARSHIKPLLGDLVEDRRH